MGKGHWCPLCKAHTFHNHCPICKYTKEEAEQVLLESLQGGSEDDESSPF